MNRRRNGLIARSSDSGVSQTNNNHFYTESFVAEEQAFETFINSEENKPHLLHTPNPHPGRGVYGFALYLFSWILFIIYLLWAFLPDWILKLLCLTYLPPKYWAIIIPLLIPVVIGIYVIFSFIINLFRFRGVFDSSEVLNSDFLDLVE